MKIKNDIIMVAIVKNDKDEVLLVRLRNEETGKDGAKLTWTFPGGRVEDEEKSEDAVEREVLEETGYKVKVNELISDREHPEFPVHLCYYDCELLSDKKAEAVDEDIKEVRWVEIDQIRNMITSDLYFEIAEFLEI